MNDTNMSISAYESEIAARLQRSLRPLLDVAAGEIDPTVLSNAGLRRAAIELYRLSDELIPSEMSEGDLLSYYRDVLLPLEGVSVYLEPGAIFVRTPMLAGRQSKQEIQSPRDKDIIFADSVHYAILADNRYIGYDFSAYKDKLISFLFIYSEQAYPITSGLCRRIRLRNLLVLVRLIFPFSPVLTAFGVHLTLALYSSGHMHTELGTLRSSYL